MPAALPKLKKLSGRSWHEVRVRGGQELAKIRERLLAARFAEMSDAALLRALEPSARNGSAEGTAALVIKRLRAQTGQAFLPALVRRAEVVGMMERRFGSERDAIIARAENICAGRFNLLGLTNLCFGDPIDWRLEPTTGCRTPLAHWSRIDYLSPEIAGDKKVTWELNRHQGFVTLGQAYWLTGDERFAAAFVTQASSWIDANPPKRGINWVSSLELAFRAISWVWALHLLSGAESLTPRFVCRALKHLAAHGHHIETYLSHYFSPNTHLTGEALGLFYLGLALPELRRARIWRELGMSVLLAQLSDQVQSDGVYFEQSSYYHRYTADFYTHLLVLARSGGITFPGGSALPDAVEQKLVQLLDHLMWITRPDSSSPLLGDDDGGRLVLLGERQPDDFRDTLATGAALFGRGDWKFVAGEPAVETLWLLGPEGLANYDRIKSTPPRTQERAFADSGYYVMRDGWARDSSFVLIDVGQPGVSGTPAMKCSGHAHAGALSFEFAAAGETWIVDPGTFTYTGDVRWRDWFRTTQAHNTATVDGISQSIPRGPFSWERIAQGRATEFGAQAGCIYFAGEHDGYEHLDDPVGHARTVLLTKRDEKWATPAHLIVRDKFTARGLHSYALRFHLAASCRVLSEGLQVKIIGPSGGELIIAAFSLSRESNICDVGRASAPVSLRAHIESGWVSRCYGQREAAPVVVIETEGRGDQHFVTLLIPRVNGEADLAQQIISRLAASRFSLSAEIGAQMNPRGIK
jgi:hypothetical protein